MSAPAIITAALTGPVARKRDNPHLPCSPAEIADAAAEAHAAGAAIVHLHLRDEAGEPTARLDVAQRVLEAVQQSCPAIIQLSTGAGLDVPYEDRMRLVEARPRMATLNVCTMSFGAGEFRNPPDGVRALAARMRELNIKPELELYDFGHLDVAIRLLEEDLLVEPLQFSIVLGVRGGMSATPANLVHLLASLPPRSTWQVIAIGRANLEMVTIGLAMGGNARTGLEDTLMLRRGVPAASNRQLVERLVAVSEAIERPIASLTETTALLELG